MAVSRKLCGAVIGQKGATIREFMADSGATIRVQPLAELTPSDSERLISVSGSRDRVLRAVALILNTVGVWGGVGGRGQGATMSVWEGAGRRGKGATVSVWGGTGCCGRWHSSLAR
jgi:hypothetical protein